VPSFSEYRRALDAAGYTTVQLPLHAERDFRIDTGALAETIAHERAQLCIIANPHNPSGLALPRGAIEQLLHAASNTGTFILLDEAFIDYLPEESLTPVAAQTENLIVLRSLTKFYGMPALRIGYAVASPGVASAIRAQIPSWPVTTLAASAALEALRDTEYAERTREMNADERSRLTLALAKTNLRVFRSTANFLLIELPQNSPPIWNLRARLIREHKIIVRDCSNYETLSDGRYLRVAVRGHADNERLIAALSAVLTSGE
jgi:threonine-phosphate decarboxylase